MIPSCRLLHRKRLYVSFLRVLSRLMYLVQVHMCIKDKGHIRLETEKVESERLHERHDLE